jgi:hypothetical protein
MNDIETRLTAAFGELADVIPDSPPSTFQEASAWYAVTLDAEAPDAETEFWKRGRRWSRRPRSLTALVVGGIIATGGVGTGIAAAAGAFSPSPSVQHTLSQLTKNASGIAGAQSPTPVTQPTPETEHFLVTDPGPEGTTISVWASSPMPGVNCFVAEVSEAGEPTFAGKPPQQDGGGCGGSPDPTASASATLLTGGGGSIWRSPSGALYMIVSSATVPGTARVTITFADGTTITPAIGSGWFAFGVPYGEWAGGFVQIESAGSGSTLYTFKQAPAQSR